MVHTTQTNQSAKHIQMQQSTLQQKCLQQCFDWYAFSLYDDNTRII